jgi:hypothetical protein
MDRTPINSSNLAEVGYDPTSSTLEIMFVDGRVYQYFDVPENIHTGLLGAASAGQFFHREIRGVYRFARI